MTAIVRGRWFPATVQLPTHTYRRVYALLTDGDERAGLHLWRRPKEVSDVLVRIDWGNTPLPGQRQLLRDGLSFALPDGGRGSVAPGSGCRCGSLGQWAGPSWATRTAVA